MIPFHSKTFRILKAATHEMALPAMLALKQEIYPYVAYRTLKGSWELRIIIGKYGYQVVVQKTEITISKDVKEYFDFT